MTDWTPYDPAALDVLDFPENMEERILKAASMYYPDETNLPDGVIEINLTSNQPFRRENNAWIPFKWPASSMPDTLSSTQRVVRETDRTLTSSGGDAGMSGLTTEADSTYFIRGYFSGTKQNADSGNIVDIRIQPNNVVSVSGTFHMSFRSYDSTTLQTNPTSYEDVTAPSSTTIFGFSFEGVFQTGPSGAADVNFFTRLGGAATGTTILKAGCFAELTKTS